MRVTVLLFGQEREAAGSGKAMLELLDDARCSVVRRALARAIPALEPFMAQARFAVNGEFVADDHQLKESDEVALIGMVSGG